MYLRGIIYISGPAAVRPAEMQEILRSAMLAALVLFLAVVTSSAYVIYDSNEFPVVERRAMHPDDMRTLNQALGLYRALDTTCNAVAFLMFWKQFGGGQARPAPG